MDTGIVRKIDELGRIVIPKEIRKSLNIRNGEDVEIYVSEGCIVLKKFERLLNIKEKASSYIDMFKKCYSKDIVVSDIDKVIVSNNNDIINKELDTNVMNIINERKISCGKGIKFGDITLDKCYMVSPLITDGDLVGAIILISDKQISEVDRLFCSMFCLLMLREM